MPDYGGCYWCCSIRPIPEIGPRPHSGREISSECSWLRVAGSGVTVTHHSEVQNDQKNSCRGFARTPVGSIQRSTPHRHSIGLSTSYYAALSWLQHEEFVRRPIKLRRLRLAEQYYKWEYTAVREIFFTHARMLSSDVNKARTLKAKANATVPRPTRPSQNANYYDKK